MPTCSVCPAGLTTLTPGSMSRFLCAVPLEGPDKTIIGSGKARCSAKCLFKGAIREDQIFFFFFFFFFF